MAFLRVLWEHWKRFAHRLGNFQSRLLMFVFYYVVAPPFALGLKLLADPLRLRSESGEWTPRPERAGDPLSAARREF
jgi:hypothetical protein